MQCDTIIRENINLFKNVLPDPTQVGNRYNKYNDSGVCNSSCDSDSTNDTTSTATTKCLLCKKVVNKIRTMMFSGGVNSLPKTINMRNETTDKQCTNADRMIQGKVAQITNNDSSIARHNQEIKVLKDKLVLKDALMKQIREKISSLDINLISSVEKDKTKGRTGFDVWSYYLFGINTDIFIWILIGVSILLTVLLMYLSYELVLVMMNYFLR